MKIFHYDEQTGELIGEGVADPDPLDVGNWLIPAHATDIEPPNEVTGSTRHFIARGWEYREIPPPVIDEPPVNQPAPTVEPAPATDTLQ